MARATHNYEQVAEDLANWIERKSELMRDAMLDNGRAPFEQPMTTAEKLKYYEDMLYNPDGSPNIAGRQQVIQAAGVAGYVKVTQIVNKALGKGNPPGAAPLPEGAQWVAGGPETLPEPQLPPGSRFVKGG